MTTHSPELTRCRKCEAFINTMFGADSPAEHQEATGTQDDPRAPGDWDDICAHCNYNPDNNERHASGCICADCSGADLTAEND